MPICYRCLINRFIDKSDDDLFRYPTESIKIDEQQLLQLEKAVDDFWEMKVINSIMELKRV